LHTFTKYSGYDPEITGSSDALVQGLDNAAYPIAKFTPLGLIYFLIFKQNDHETIFSNTNLVGDLVCSARL
jgi:hypothetical protein